MKTCKYCKEEIAEEASKCPKCQSHQKWYGNPLLISLLPLILIFSFLYHTMTTKFESVDFEEFKEKITLRKLSQDTILINNKKIINILVEVENKSDQKWKNAIYEVKYLSKSGKLLNVERDSDYKFVLRANEKSLSSVKVPIYEEYKEAILELKLSELSHDRF